jgi:hypothetical protein
MNYYHWHVSENGLLSVELIGGGALLLTRTEALELREILGAAIPKMPVEIESKQAEPSCPS